LFGFWPESVHGVRFAKARPNAGLRGESIALKTGKMRSHTVISQTQLFGKFVHGPFSRSQEVKDFSPRAFEQPLPPAYMFHSFKDHEDSE
jgi:hypothetical protein